MSIAYVGGKFGISIADVTTGDYYVTEVATERNVLDEINKFTPSEIICNHSFLMCGMDIEDIKNRLSISVFELEEWYFDEENCSDILKEHFNIIDLSGLGISEMSLGIIASGSLLKYLYETQKNSLSHLSKLIPYSTSTFMILDTSTRRNLELCETLREKQKRGSLLWVLDKTKTAMGARTLRNYIEQPLIDKEEIINRQKVIEELNNSLITRDELREYLAPIYDLERLLSKISYRSANPRDLIAFKTSLEMLPHIKNIIKDFKSPLFLDILGRLDTLEDITKLIAESINDDPPINIKEGGIIRSGYNEEIDKLRSDKTCFDALGSTLPAGTLSGAPKIRAMEIIDELEKTKRSTYGGAIGYISFNGNFDSCITIRTGVFKDGKAYIQAGGGIVYDSIPENEYRESINKASAVLRAIEEAGDIV